MKHPADVAVTSLLGLALMCGPSFGSDDGREVVSPAGQVIRVLGKDASTPTDRQPPAAKLTRAWPVLSTQAKPGAAAAPTSCPVTPTPEGRQVRESRRDGVTVDACGRVTRDSGQETPGPPSLAAAASSGATIDRMTTYGYGATYSPGGPISLLGSADTYFLSDGSSWTSGAGVYYDYASYPDRVEVAGSTIRYVLLPPPQGLLYEQTDYDFGEHSSQGRLGVAGPLVIETTEGSTTAVMRGLALVASNEATWYGEPRFNYYSAVVGSVVPFELTYTLLDQTWAPDTLTRSFTYTTTGEVDFANPVSVPQPVALTISGPSQVPSNSTVQFTATLRYESDALRNVTQSSGWEVTPASLASIQAGLLTVGSPATPQETLTLRATYSEGGTTLAAEKTAVCLASPPAPGDAWPMYQANPRHTGYVPLSLDAQRFAVRWQRDLGGGLALNPVAAAEGKVFASLVIYFNDTTQLFALDALSGETLWSKGFGSVFSVNPPSYSYGTVYVQTGNHAQDTWLRAYDAQTGAPVFQAPHEAQWERYKAPTVYEGKVYVNGGTYGGMYAFDQFSGEQQWFLALPQYDGWTPAVDGALTFAYVGEYAPGLYAADRLTGALRFVIADPNFEWDGWSMDVAPVLGAHDDVIAVHDGRLISFDTAGRTIRWELQRQFAGQPAVANDRIYAIDGGRLVVLDEMSHTDLWSWTPPAGALQGAMIVTDTHVLASTATDTYAVDLSTRETAWSFPAGGDLAIGEGALYIASPDGILTAVSVGEYVPAPLLRLEISGPSEVVEGSSAMYGAAAYYEDGRVRNRTLDSEWSVEPATYASMGPGGMLTTTELLQPSQDVVVRARYTERGQTVEATAGVRLFIGVTIQQFIRRNLEAAVQLKSGILNDLEMALARERAARDALPRPPYRRTEALVDRAIEQEVAAKELLRRTIEILRSILDPPAGSTTGPERRRRQDPSD